MMRAGIWLDLMSVATLGAALIAWLLGPGWWTSILGSLLLGFGPGYLLLRGAAHSVPSLVVRAGLYLGSSLAISILIGLGITTLGMPLEYGSVASAYMLIVALLIVAQVAASLRSSNHRVNTWPPIPTRQSALTKGLVLVALPLAGTLALLGTTPVRSQPNTEVYFAPRGGQIRSLPVTYGGDKPLEFRVVVVLGTPAMDAALDVTANDHLVAAWKIPLGSTSLQRVVSIDTSAVKSGTLRVEARLSSAGQPDHTVWLTLTEETAN